MEQTRGVGEQIGRELRGGDVVALSGELGAGKTCFTQGLARGLGVDSRIPITSPSFTLVGEYPGRLALRHADFYRVESYARLEDAGFEELLAPDGVLVVEWAERFPEALPPDRIELRLEVIGAEERRITLMARGERARERVRRIEKLWR
ncbi:MAG: tRNA (adenosine(37)-N6)-threonylcarbamoyltransferase complex ATPase subunit type 1 TsaE [Myxococcota bacterium]